MSNNNSMDGSISTSSISLKSSGTNLPKQHKHRHSVDNSPSTETSHFHVRVSSIAVILLHEDILTTCVEGSGLTCSSIQQMKNAADEFFKQLGMFAASGYGNKDFDKASKLLLNACHSSHIRCAQSAYKHRREVEHRKILIDYSLQITRCTISNGRKRKDYFIVFCNIRNINFS